MVQLDHQDQKDHLDLKEMLVHLDHLVPQVTKDHQESQVQMVLLDQKDKKEKVAVMGCQDYEVQLVIEETSVHLAIQELMEEMEKMVLKDLQAYQEILDHKVNQEKEVPKDQ